jgi:hypothetical protein
MHACYVTSCDLARPAIANHALIITHFANHVLADFVRICMYSFHGRARTLVLIIPFTRQRSINFFYNSLFQFPLLLLFIKIPY